MQGHNQDSSVMLMNGHRMELCSEKGANDFLTSGHRPFNFFSVNIPEADNIREKALKRTNKNLKAAEKNRLQGIYFAVYSFTGYSHPGVFAQNVSEDELKFYFEHCSKYILIMKDDKTWRQQGKLEEHDKCLLDSILNITKHEKCTKLAFHLGLFENLADFLASCPKPTSLPCRNIAETICLICGHAYISVNLAEKQVCWSTEKFVKKFEATGMLYHLLRCSTVPLPTMMVGTNGEDMPCLMKLYNDVATSSSAVKKIFQVNQPCGKLLKDILDGKDGSKERPPRRLVLNTFRKILSLSNFIELDKKGKMANGRSMMNSMCRYCSKCPEDQKLLMTCARCKVTYYCSKECQKKDWKAHKLTCTPGEKGAEKKMRNEGTTLMTFAQNNYATIMKKLVKFCDAKNLTKSDVVLEVDFKPDLSGTSPAMRDPPEFVIKDYKGYIDGDKPNAPDWFAKKDDQEMYERNIKRFVLAMKDKHARMTESDLLCLVRYGDDCTALRLTLQLPDGSGDSLFSEKAVSAFRRGVKDKDYGPLTELFGRLRVSR